MIDAVVFVIRCLLDMLYRTLSYTRPNLAPSFSALAGFLALLHFSCRPYLRRVRLNGVGSGLPLCRVVNIGHMTDSTSDDFVGPFLRRPSS